MGGEEERPKWNADGLGEVSERVRRGAEVDHGRRDECRGGMGRGGKGTISRGGKGEEKKQGWGKEADGRRNETK